MRNPFRTLRTHTATIARLEAEISDLKTELTAQAEKIAALVRDDQQIEALRKIQAAVEYTTAAHKHDRESHGQRHEF